jgi:hypothetical protein
MYGLSITETLLSTPVATANTHSKESAARTTEFERPSIPIDD